MTRIISGRAKGHRLTVPSSLTRPTSDRVKEAVFSRLDSWGALQGADTLDLYAGSGALGLEAWSRGAAFVDFVEAHRPNATTIKRNMTHVGCSAGRVHCAKTMTYLQQTHGQWDLVFADPPYSVTDEDVNSVIDVLASTRLRPGATVVIERGRSSAPPHFDPHVFTDVSHKKYGDTFVYYAYFQGGHDD